MTSGRHNDYYWIQWESPPLIALLRRVPRLVLGRYLINTSYDSGSLTLSEEQLEQGWRSAGTLTYSPLIADALTIPHDQFDEWLVFAQATEIQSWTPIVNYSGFSLTDTNYEGMQEELWEQVECVRPESYLAHGDQLIFITSNRELYELALAQKELDPAGI